MWDLDLNYYPWLRDGDRPSVVENISSLQQNYGPDNFWQDAASAEPLIRIVGAVHIQAEHDPRDHVRETTWLQGLADAPGSKSIPQAIVGNADLAAPDVEGVIERHCAHRNMRGIRQALHRRLTADPYYDPLEDPAFQRNFGLLARYGLSFDLQYFQEQALRVVALVQKHPNVQFILTHAGMPLQTNDEYVALWRRNLKMLAQFPNVAIKISGFGLADPDWNTDTVKRMGQAVITMFGIERCMLASNFPVERVHRSYSDIWHAFSIAFRDASAAERDALFIGNAMRFYRIDPSTIN